MTLAVVVCSRDRPDRLRRCLQSLVGQAADEVLVVDSASRSDRTREVAAAFGLRCIRKDRPGLARARNAGVEATDATVIAFTDDDCAADPDWVQAIRAAAREESTGFVLGRVRAAGAGPALSVHLDDRPRVLTVADDAASAGHGANLAVRRACWDAVGGFDEMLGAGSRLRAGEDTDLVWRAVQAGWQGRYDPAAVVTHEQWRGRLAALRISYGYGVGAGAVRSKARRLSGGQAVRGVALGSLRATARQAGHDARAGYAFGVAVCVARAGGVVAGRWQASRLQIDHGCLRPR